MCGPAMASDTGESILVIPSQVLPSQVHFPAPGTVASMACFCIPIVRQRQILGQAGLVLLKSVDWDSQVHVCAKWMGGTENQHGTSCRRGLQQAQSERSIPGPEDVPLSSASSGPLAQGLAAAAAGKTVSAVPDMIVPIIRMPCASTIHLALLGIAWPCKV